MRPVLRVAVASFVAWSSGVVACKGVKPEPEPTQQRAAVAEFALGAGAAPVTPPHPSEPPRGVAPTTGSANISSGTPSISPRLAVAPELRRLVVSGAIKDKEPVPMAALKVNDPVVAFLELGNTDPEGSVVQVVFQHESGHEVGFVKLLVPAGKARWRTWAQTGMIKLAGKWTAIVRSENGAELGQQGFFVSPT